MNTIFKDRVCIEVAKDFNELVNEQNLSPNEAYQFIAEEFLTELEDFTEEEELAEKSLVFASIFNELYKRDIIIEEVMIELAKLIKKGADLPFYKDNEENYDARKTEWEKIYKML